MRQPFRLTVAIASALALAVWASSSGAATVRPCAARALTGTFRAVPGSAGAGNIVYALRLQNSSHTSCYVTGIPGLTLLDGKGRALPTHGTPAQPGALTAVVVALSPGASARSTARFSPDIPGPGEPVKGDCERTAVKLRVAPAGGGTLVVPIIPATPVCEHGRLSLTVLTAA